MKTLFALGALVLGLHTANASASSSMFYEPCFAKQASVNLPNENGDLIVLASAQSGFAGMSCQDLRSTLDGASIVSITMMPVTLASKMAGLDFLAELEGFGIAASAPAVLGVTVMVGITVTTVYLVMRQALQDCEARERNQMKREIIEELKYNYSLKPSQGVNFTINDDGGRA